MFSTTGKKVAALGLLWSGIVVGVAGAQVAATFHRVGSTTSGLFTISNGQVMNFHVALDDDDSGPVGKVQMRLIDDTGTVRAKKLVSLEPGQSATLSWPRPGKYRAQYDVLESSTSLIGPRRRVAGSVELYEVDDLVANPPCCVKFFISLPIPDPKG
jgi:hypothetical protein